MRFSSPLSDREKALEDAFFRKENEKLIASLRAKKAQSEQLAALAKVLGVGNEAVLTPLLSLGVRAESCAALVLAPLVAVAWADHQLDDDERRRVVEAGQHYGIDPQSDAGKLLATWLAARPHESLIDVWASFAQELGKALQPTERDRLQNEIVERSRSIARAFEKSFLRGGGPSRAEAEVLAKIEKAFGSLK